MEITTDIANDESLIMFIIFNMLSLLSFCVDMEMKV